MQAGPQMQFVDDGKKKKGKKGLIAAIIAAVIVVLGVGAALVYMLVLNTPSKQFLMICRFPAIKAKGSAI